MYAAAPPPAVDVHVAAPPPPPASTNSASILPVPEDAPDVVFDTVNVVKEGAVDTTKIPLYPDGVRPVIITG